MEKKPVNKTNELLDDTSASLSEVKPETCSVENAAINEICALLSFFPILLAASLKALGVKNPDWLVALMDRKKRSRGKQLSEMVKSQDIVASCDEKTEYSNLKISRFIAQLPEQLIETSKTTLVRIMAAFLAIIGFCLGIGATGYVTADFIRTNGDSGAIGTSIGIAFIAASFGSMVKGAINGPFRAQKEGCEKVFAILAILGFCVFAVQVTGEYFYKQAIQLEDSEAELSLDFSDSHQSEAPQKPQIVKLQFMYLGALLAEAYYSFLMATMFLWSQRPHIKEIVNTIDDNLYKERQKEASNARLRRKHKARAAPRELDQKEMQAPAKLLERVIQKLLK